MNNEPFFRICAKILVPGHECQGRITWDHPFTFAGKQMIEPVWTVPVCAYGHGVDQFQDGGDRIAEVHKWIALCRATDAEVISVSKAVNYVHMKKYLIDKYGVFDEQASVAAYLEKYPPLLPGEPPALEPAKKMWHLVTAAQQKKLEQCIEWHKDIEGVRYSAAQMFDRMITDYHKEVETMMSDLIAN